MTSRSEANLEYRGVPGIDYLDDNSAEAIALSPAMAAACVACPYIDGTEASRSPVTSRIATECASARHAFWCHLTTGDEGSPTHLCGGWMAAIETSQANLSNGSSPLNPLPRKGVGIP